MRDATGATSDWQLSGAVRLFHFYVSHRAFERAVAEALDADPARVRLREATYFRDPVLEGVVRGALLPLSWDEPAERVALSHAGHALVALLAARMTDRIPRAPTRGGLAAAALRRVAELVETRLADPLAVEDLAAAAGLSVFHFARAFRQATGQGSPPSWRAWHPMPDGHSGQWRRERRRPALSGTPGPATTTSPAS